MVYANDSKSFGGNPLRVQVSLPALKSVEPKAALSAITVFAGRET